MTTHVRFLVLSCAAVACAGLLSTPGPAHAQSVKLEPEKMSKIGTVDERFQSYNVEMLEVTGGRFWAPYKHRTMRHSDTKTGDARWNAGLACIAIELRSISPIRNCASWRAALGPAYVRVSGTWANSTYFQDSDDPAPATPPTGFNGVLTRKQWHGVMDFAHAVDAKICYVVCNQRRA